MRLHDPEVLSRFLSRFGISASKGLGQHFLCSEETVGLIVGALGPYEGLCEIGPGPGVLTSVLAERCRRMIALEVDARMVSALRESAPKAEVRTVDALKVDLGAILRELPQPRAVVSNLPYYITGPLLAKVADARGDLDFAVLMMQKEVAQRVIAPPGHGDRGALSVMLQSQFDIALLAHAPARLFFPPPKVDSTVLTFVPGPVGADLDREGAFLRLVRLGFSQPRKTLANNLVASLKLSREEAISAIEGIGLSEKVRPHDLTEENWRTLADQLVLGSKP